MRMTITLLTTALLLGACEKEAPEAAQPAKAVSVRSEAQKQLSAASELDRAIGLKRAIMASGSACGRVTSTGFVGPYKNLDYWTATCVDSFKRSREWAIFVGADDSVQVRLCKDTEAVGLPACIAKPGTEGGSGAPGSGQTKKRTG